MGNPSPARRSSRRSAVAGGFPTHAALYCNPRYGRLRRVHDRPAIVK
jgi:hypothetical protein